jgi:hypothetical protein
VPKSSRQLAEALATRLRGIERMRVRLESLANANHLTTDVVTSMYDGLFLSAHVAFEGFLEELFVGLLVENRGCDTSRSDVHPRVTVRTHAIARQLIQGRRGYVDWLPYENTVYLATQFFRAGRPFTDLGKADTAHLKRCHIVRNVIAHRSRASVRKFEENVLGSTPVLPAERVPAGFLRGLYRVSPAQSRFENYSSQLLSIARKLAQ